MPKLRIYVETSVWSFAFAEDAPDYRADTLAFFERCRGDAYEVFVSSVVLEEIARAPDRLRTRLMELVRDIRPRVLDVTDEATQLSDIFIHQGVVPRGKPEDARHVAVAFDAEMDVLVSWNFRHIANLRRAERFNAVAVFAGYYRPLRIVSPAEVLYDDGTEPD